MIENLIRKFLGNKIKSIKTKDNHDKFFSSNEELERLTRQLNEKDAELKNHYTLVEAENNILRLITKGKEFHYMLRKIVDTIESFDGNRTNIYGSILCYNEDDNRLYSLYTETLPKEYEEITKLGIPVEENSLTSGLAAFHKKIIITKDIKSSRYWDNYPTVKEKALKHGIKACYSSPILGSNNKLLGSIEIHFKDDSYLDPIYKQLLCWSAKMSSIIFERKNSEIKLNNNIAEIQYKNKLLESIMDASGGYLWMKDENHKYKFCDYNYQFTFFGQKSKYNVIGKTDKELIEKFKEETGKHHQFREICIRTDEHTKESKTQCRYIEGGYINGKLLIFEVIKTPLFDHNGTYKGIVGFSWDRSDELNLVFTDIKQLKEEGRIEIISDKEYPETPFIYYIIPNKKYYRKLISKPLYEDPSIIDKRVFIEESCIQ